jgi:CRP/FNR family cyclic AMP-dependent transcriptional regulator
VQIDDHRARTKDRRGQLMERPPEVHLDSIGLLASLPRDDLNRLEQTCGWHRFAAGEEIFDWNSHSRDIFLILRGRVKLVNHSMTGREVAFATDGAGGYFGELAAVDGEPRSAAAIAIEDCLLASLAPETFNELLLKYPAVMHEVMSRLAQIIRVCDERIMDLSTLGAMQRIHLELLRRAEPDPLQRDIWVIHPMPTAKTIAESALTSRETVSRVLSQLQSGGIVRRKDRSLCIADRARLEAVTNRINAMGDERVAR